MYEAWLNDFKEVYSVRSLELRSEEVLCMETNQRLDFVNVTEYGVNV